MPTNKTQILDHKQIEQKINRIAYQIFENNYDQEQLIIAGIASNGFILAQLLADKLREISPIEIILEELHINKKDPIKSEVSLNLNSEAILKKSIIVVDDVLNSGKTMMYGLQYFLTAPLKSLSTAVLVDRSHKRFPVNADYVGMSLATTMKEHIEVSFDNGNYTAFLS